MSSWSWSGEESQFAYWLNEQLPTSSGAGYVWASAELTQKGAATRIERRVKRFVPMADPAIIVSVSRWYHKEVYGPKV
jgi:hypothetical protein